MSWKKGGLKQSSLKPRRSATFLTQSRHTATWLQSQEAQVLQHGPDAVDAGYLGTADTGG